MSDKGIIFSAPMVQALLAGRKTQTRRLLNLAHGSWAASEPPTGSTWTRDDGFKPNKRAGQPWALHSPYLNGSRLLHGVCQVPFTPGDRLYVREAWRVSSAQDALPPRDIPRGLTIEFAADGLGYLDGKYRHARFAPRWASRITLTVTEVRMQRLQDISENDCYEEGRERPSGPRLGSDVTARDNARNWYRALWNSLHTKPGETWADNPWVVAVSFNVRLGNIDKEETCPN